MSQPFTVYFDPERDPGFVTNANDLDTLLDRLSLDPVYLAAPPLVEIVSADERRMLDIGIANPDHSVLIWHDDDADEVMASLGTISAAAAVAFDFGGTWTTMPRDATVPVEVARQAVREFIRTGQRPTAVDWQVPVYDGSQ